MNIFKIIASYVESLNPPKTGALRNDDDLGMVTHKEFAGGGVEWSIKSTYRSFPKRDQSSSLSCVMQSNAKARGVTYANQGGNFPVLSALPYNRRSNFPGQGTIPLEGLQLTSQGLPLESLYPSENMTETQMDNAPKPTMNPVYGGGIPVKLPNDMDTIANALDSGYGVVLCNNFASAEYTQYVPKTIRGVFRGVDHQIAVVDRTIYQGQKALVCEDSAFLSSTNDGQRLITEEFMLNHSYFIGYVRNVTAPKYQAIPKPIHTFTVDLQFGMTGNEVIILQKRLIYEGLLSPDCASGYFGALSLAAVIAYQGAQGLPQTGYVGTLTRAKLNQ